MAVSALAQLLDQQPTAYAEVLAACRAMGWNASPTAQPADIIDELPSNVLPFIRRMLALLIYGDGSADSPAVVPVTERCYAQLVPRVTSPNYSAAGFPSDRDPFTHAPSIRDFAHLDQALSALSARKITNGGAENDGIVDGMSLARLVCSSNSSVTKIVDDSNGWVFNNSNMIATLINLYPNCNEFILGCKSITTQVANMGSNRAVKFVFTGCETINVQYNLFIGQQSSVGGAIPGFPNGEVHIYGLKTTNQTSNTSPSLVIGKAYFHDYERGVYLVNGSATWSIQSMYYIYIGCKGKKTDTIRFWASEYGVNGSVKDVEIREGACQNLTLQNLNGLTAKNMYNHILLRLKQDEPLCGSGVTITLGTTNIEKLEAVEEYNTKLTELEDTYGYTFA